MQAGVVTQTNHDDKVGETTLYSMDSYGKTVLTIRKYTPDADINIDEDPPYLMSIAYMAGTRGTVFLLTDNGYVVGKSYEWSPKKKEYILKRQTSKLDSVDWIFDKFEADFYTSPQLQSLDFDLYSHGASISKSIAGAPACMGEEEDDKEESDDEEEDEDEVNEELNKFSKQRDKLSYIDKLNQQLGKRKDSIEYVLCVLTHWKEFVCECCERRHGLMKDRLKMLKRHEDDKLLSLIDDPRSDEDKINDAVDELEQFQKKAAQGCACTSTEVLYMNSRLPKIQAVLSRQGTVADKIEEMLSRVDDELENEEVDLGFSELEG